MEKKIIIIWKPQKIHLITISQKRIHDCINFPYHSRKSTVKTMI